MCTLLCYLRSDGRPELNRQLAAFRKTFLKKVKKSSCIWISARRFWNGSRIRTRLRFWWKFNDFTEIISSVYLFFTE